MTINKFYNFDFECKMTVKDTNNLSVGILLDIHKSTTDTLALKVLDIQPDLSVVLRDVSDTATGQLPVGEYKITIKACGSRVVVTVSDSVAGTEHTTNLLIEYRGHAYLGFVNNSSVEYSEIKLAEKLELPTTGVALFNTFVIPKNNPDLSQELSETLVDRDANYRLPNRNVSTNSVPWDYETVDVNKWYLKNETFIDQSDTDSTRILLDQKFRMVRSNGDVIEIVARFNRDDYHLQSEKAIQRALGRQTYEFLLAQAEATAAAQDPPQTLTQDEKYNIAAAAGQASGLPENPDTETYPLVWANPNFNQSDGITEGLADYKLFNNFIFEQDAYSYVQYLVGRPSVPALLASYVSTLDQFGLTTLSSLASEGLVAAFIVFLLSNKLALQGFPDSGFHPTPVTFDLTPAEVVNTINSIVTVGNHNSRLDSSIINLETAYAALPP